MKPLKSFFEVNLRRLNCSHYCHNWFITSENLQYPVSSGSILLHCCIGCLRTSGFNTNGELTCTKASSSLICSPFFKLEQTGRSSKLNYKQQFIVEAYAFICEPFTANSHKGAPTELACYQIEMRWIDAFKVKLFNLMQIPSVVGI